MSGSDIVVSCACGFTARGPEDEVVAAAREHGREVHNMEASREDVLATARPAG